MKFMFIIQSLSASLMCYILLKVYKELDRILIKSAVLSAQDDTYKKKAKTTTLVPSPAV